MKKDKLAVFSRRIDWLSAKVGFGVSLLLLFLIAVILYGSFKRYIVKDMPSWAYEVSIFLYGTIAFAGGSYCLLKGKHVCVDIFKNKLSAKVSRTLEIIFNLTALVCMSYVMYYAGIWAFESTMILERSEHQTTFNPQIWWFKWIVVLSIFAVILQFVSEMIKLVRGEVPRETPAGDSQG